MMDSEKQIRIAAKLYDARDAVKRLLPEKEYQQSVNFMRAVLKRVQEQQRCDELVAAMWLVRRVDPADSAEKMLILATAVEMIEPSFTEGKKGDERG